ncbi:hypothetical protein F2Q69_00028398 [Brassica cretica]|uniref:Uncharacterized protein n=1 Tax=Brassica cretica TaxID=69181 RepID=A0A8S9RPY8_BRACR|nr:hypothetical protein F2Q69_00028398 [Brassica cretica]
MTYSFLERTGQPEVYLVNKQEESVSFNVLAATFILEFSSSQMFLMIFCDSLGSTETERNALMLEDFSLSIIGFTKMNKHLVETFVAFRNSHGRSRYAEDDQEDTPGDEVLAIDQGRRGRMRNRELVLVLFSWRKVTTRFSILLSTTALAIGAVSAANLSFIFPDIVSFKCFVAMNMGNRSPPPPSF